MNAEIASANNGNPSIDIGFKEIVVISSVYLYFSGWTYIYFLFDGFGISLHAVDIPFYYFFVYSYSVIETHAISTMFVVVSLFVFLCFSRYMWSKYLIAVLLVALFPATFYIARQTALKEVRNIRSEAGASYPEVRFTLKGAYPAKHSDQRSTISFDALNDGWSLKLLTHTSKYFYAVYVPKKLPKVKALPMTQVFIIPSDNIERVETRIDIPVQ